MPGLHWSEREDAVLRASWHECSERGLRALLRGRSWGAIYQRAQRLGLPLGVPQGYESLHAAERRTGFDREQLARILEAHGVRTFRWYRKPGPPARVSLRRYVDSGDVDDAVAAWLDTATVAAAARARGIHQFVLWERLVKRGLIRPVRRGKPQRVTEAQVALALVGYVPRRRAS